MKNATLLLFVSALAGFGASGCATQGAAAPKVARADACSLQPFSPAVATASERPAASTAPVAAAVRGSQIAACLSGLALSRDGGWASATF